MVSDSEQMVCAIFFGARAARKKRVVDPDGLIFRAIVKRARQQLLELEADRFDFERSWG